jgi:TPR repeat protein
MWHLGLAYQSGAGVQKDMTQAREWIRKSADLGYLKAKQWLASHEPTTEPSTAPSSVSS